MKTPSSDQSRIVLKTKKGTPLDHPIKCDECKIMKPHITQFSKSNRNYCVNICSDCLPRVLARSFPRSCPDNSSDDEYIWDENFDNDDLEVSSDDGMNRATRDGAFESNRRRH